LTGIYAHENSQVHIPFAFRGRRRRPMHFPFRRFCVFFLSWTAGCGIARYPRIRAITPARRTQARRRESSQPEGIRHRQPARMTLASLRTRQEGTKDFAGSGERPPTELKRTAWRMSATTYAPGPLALHRTPQRQAQQVINTPAEGDGHRIGKRRGFCHGFTVLSTSTQSLKWTGTGRSGLSRNCFETRA